MVIWRETMAISIGLILAPPLEKSPWDFLATLVTLTPCLRSSVLTVLMLSACSSPETFCPLRFTPCQRKAKTFLGALFFFVRVAIFASCNGVGCQSLTPHVTNLVKVPDWLDACGVLIGGGLLGASPVT